MNYYEFMLTILAIYSLFDLIRLWHVKRRNKELFTLLELVADKDTFQRVKLALEQFVIFLWFSWMLYKIISQFLHY